MQRIASWLIPSKAEWKAMLWGGLYVLVVWVLITLPVTSVGGPVLIDPWTRPLTFAYLSLADPAQLIVRLGIPTLLPSLLYGMLGSLVIYWMLLRRARQHLLDSRDGWLVGAAVGAWTGIAFIVQHALGVVVYGHRLSWQVTGSVLSAICISFLILAFTVAGALRGRQVVSTLQKRGIVAALAYDGHAERVAVKPGIVWVLLLLPVAMYFFLKAYFPVDRPLTTVPSTPPPFMTTGDFGILSKQPCGPPCFQGITPGVTSAKDALLLLWKKTGPCTLNGGFEGSSIACRTKHAEIWVDLSGFHQNEANSVADMIILRPPDKVTVGDFIDQYGPPDSLSLSMRDGSQAGMTLIFDRLQASASLGTQPGNTFTVTRDTIISLFTYGSISFLSGSSEPQPWKGYGTYVMPPPTPTPPPTPPPTSTPMYSLTGIPVWTLTPKSP